MTIGDLGSTGANASIPQKKLRLVWEAYQKNTITKIPSPVTSIKSKRTHKGDKRSKDQGISERSLEGNRAKRTTTVKGRKTGLIRADEKKNQIAGNRKVEGGTARRKNNKGHGKENISCISLC